jgi:hypothetical protein
MKRLIIILLVLFTFNVNAQYIDWIETDCGSVDLNIGLITVLEFDETGYYWQSQGFDYAYDEFAYNSYIFQGNLSSDYTGCRFSDVVYWYLTFTINGIDYGPYKYAWGTSTIGATYINNGYFNTNMDVIEFCNSLQPSIIDADGNDLESLFSTFIVNRDEILVTFDASVNNAIDSYGNNDFVNYNATINQAGKIGTSYLFNGSTSYLERPTVDNNLNPQYYHSVSMWVKRAGTSSHDRGTIITKGRNVHGYYSYHYSIHDYNDTGNEDYLSYYLFSGTTSVGFNYDPGSDIWTNNWVHVVITRSNYDVKEYVNGTLVQSEILSINSAYQSVTTGDFIGVDEDGWYYFNGYIDQIRIWSIELTQCDVTALYNNGDGVAYVN